MSVGADTQARLRIRIVRVIREATGLHEKFATPVAEAVLTTLHDEFRSERIYFSEDRAARDARVIEDFDGTNKEEVCRKHDISERTLYRVLHRQRRRKRRGEEAK